MKRPRLRRWTRLPGRIASTMFPFNLLPGLRSRRRLRFTRDGRYFVAISVGIGLAAINTGNNLLYLLLGWLLSVIIASGMLSDLTMRKLLIRRRPPRRLFANRPFLMEISVVNRKRRLASYSIEVEDLARGKPLDKKCYFLKIPPKKTQRTSYRHTFSKRGIHVLQGFRIGSKFPFALFRKSRDVECESELLVYPAVFAVQLPTPRARHLGDTAVARLGRRGEFFGLREYRDGDDRRAIHWRSTARSGRLLVREFEEESQRRATILCDNALPRTKSAKQIRASGSSSKEKKLAANEAVAAQKSAAAALERAISLSASLATAYIHAGYAVRLVCRGDALPFGTGEGQLTRALSLLATLEPVSDDVPFSSSIDPRAESVLVVPRGVAGIRGRPGGVAHLLEGPA